MTVKKEGIGTTLWNYLEKSVLLAGMAIQKL